MTSKFDLSGRVALVTGAGRGLGAGFAKSLAEAGATVVLTDMDDQNLARQHGSFLAAGYKAHAFRLDVTEDAQIASVVSDVETEFGRLDILVNNAGIVTRKMALDSTREDFRRIVEINNVSMMAVSSAAARLMTKNKHGRIINIASMNSMLARYGLSTYVASKHAVVGLTKTLATEWGELGITVNAIAPGYIMTELNQDVRAKTGFYDAIVERTPVGRWGEPKDLDTAIVFLASNHSGFVSGHTIFVDGGITAAFSGLPD